MIVDSNSSGSTEYVNKEVSKSPSTEEDVVVVPFLVPAFDSDEALSKVEDIERKSPTLNFL